MDKHFETLDKKQGGLEHQDWTPQVVRKKKITMMVYLKNANFSSTAKR